MSATAVHPSEIAFTCPPWCRRTRAEHLEDLGNFTGRCVHHSADQTSVDGWTVGLSSFTYPDGAPVDNEVVLVNVAVPDCDLTPSQARKLVQAIIAATAEAER
jgi:hypothetical protein